MCMSKKEEVTLYFTGGPDRMQTSDTGEEISQGHLANEPARPQLQQCGVSPTNNKQPANGNRSFPCWSPSKSQFTDLPQFPLPLVSNTTKSHQARGVTCAAASCDGPVAVCPTGGEGHTWVDGTPGAAVALASAASQRAAAASLPDNIRVGRFHNGHTAALCEATAGT